MTERERESWRRKAKKLQMSKRNQKKKKETYVVCAIKKQKVKTGETIEKEGCYTGMQQERDLKEI